MNTPICKASDIPNGGPLGSATLILDAERRTVADAGTPQDAAFIVRACNSHAQLVAALTDIETTARNTANTFPNMPGRVDLLRIAMNARAALQAAKE